MSGSCEVCHEETSKYKCPQCLVKYCSLPCFRQHKGVCEDKQTASQTSQLDSVPQPKGSSRTSTECTDSEDFVPIDRLTKLEGNVHLASMLSNPHLQDVIREVNSARNTELCLNNAMKEPLFLEFAEECLRVVENDQTYENSHNDTRMDE